ncbi:hypothetical protein ACSTIO_23710, partial [Vibrio parahaemolyticus]
VRIEFGADAELVEFEPYTYDATGDAISQRVSSLMAVSFDAPLTAMNIYDVSSLRPVYRWKGPAAAVSTRWVSSDPGVIKIDAFGRIS